jgi:hypothetical protein
MLNTSLKKDNGFISRPHPSDEPSDVREAIMSSKRQISLKGDSGASKRKSTTPKLNGSNSTYKSLQIGKAIGKPSVSQDKIVAAVRTVMREDGMIE